MKELLEIVKQLNNGTLGWGVLVVAVLSIIQIAPIKINPWSFVAKHLGRALTGESCGMMSRHMEQIDNLLGDIKKNLNALEVRLKVTESKADEDRAITARVRILKFNDELINEQLHSKESFDQVMTDIDTYERFCMDHPEFRNNKSVMSIENIKRVYAIRLEKRDFNTGEIIE